MIEPVKLSINSSSRTLVALIGFIHMGAMACILFLHLSAGIKLILLFIVGFSFIFTLYQCSFRHKRSVVKIQQVTQDEWHLLNYEGVLLRARLRGDSVITRYLIILNFSIVGKRQRKTLLLFPDMFDKQTFRRLRVQLLSDG